MPQRQDMLDKSLFITFTNLQNYKKYSQELRLSALEVFALIHGGVLPKTAEIHYKFEEIPLAIQTLQERKKVGQIAILL
jgi:hypothetical protein